MGAFIPNVLYNGFIIEGVNPFYQEVVVGLVVIAAVYFDIAQRRRRTGRQD
jgi:ribose transport system permease protein